MHIATYQKKPQLAPPTGVSGNIRKAQRRPRNPYTDRSTEPVFNDFYNRRAEHPTNYPCSDAGYRACNQGTYQSTSKCTRSVNS